MKFNAHFTAQAWCGDYAIHADPLGDTDWDCTEYMLALSPAERLAAMEPDDYPSDNVRGDPNAPQWVKDWSGPFYITVTGSE